MRPSRALDAAVAVCALLITAPAASAAPGALTRLGQATGAGGLRAVAVSPDGRDVYAVAQAESRVTAYRRAPSGLVTAVDVETDGAGGVTSLAGALSVAVSPDGLDVYVAAGADAAVTQFRRDPATGVLTPAGCVNETGTGGCDAGSGLSGAEGVAVSPDGASVYVTGPTDMALNVLTRAVTGDLTYTGCFKDIGASESCALGAVQGLAGANQVAVAPDGRNVYVTGTNDDAVVTFQRAPGGTLTPRTCVADTGGLCNSATEGLDGARGLAVSADGANVYAAGRDDDALVAFTRDPIAGDLIPLDLELHGAGGVSGLDGPEGLAAAPDSATVYAGSVDSETLAAFSRDAAGRLTFLQCLHDGTADAGCAGAEGLDDANAIALPADGAHVYVSSRGDASVTVFTREPLPAGPGVGPTASFGPGGQPTGPGATPSPPSRPLICVGLWTSFCAGLQPPAPVQTCVSLWQNCTGFGGARTAPAGTIDLSGLPPSRTTRAGCDERDGPNPFLVGRPSATAAQWVPQDPVSGPAQRDPTSCLVQIHLEAPEPRGAGDAARDTRLRQFHAEVDQVAAEHLQGLALACTLALGATTTRTRSAHAAQWVAQDPVCPGAASALAALLATEVRTAFHAAKTVNRPVPIVALDVARAQALCAGDTQATCIALTRDLATSVDSSLRRLRARKAALGLDRPPAGRPRSAATAGAAGRRRVVLGSGAATLRQGRDGVVRLTFSPQARAILRAARRRGTRSLSVTAVIRASIVPGVTATTRSKATVLLRRR